MRSIIESIVGGCETTGVSAGDKLTHLVVAVVDGCVIDNGLGLGIDNLLLGIVVDKLLGMGVDERLVTHGIGKSGFGLGTNGSKNSKHQLKK
jgi:hypothetical protein